jgi:voltage-gated sodium channel
VLVASFLIFNLFTGIVIDSMEEARAIELHRAEREVIDEDHANDARAHAVILRERLHHLKDAVEDLERELAAQERGRAPR